MITKNHPTKYTNLFKAAEELLKSEAAQQIFKEQGKDFLYPADFAINNINDYFACLKDLAYLEEELPKKEEPIYVDPIFTILPTTEDTLQIDANTRDIKIPDNFVKYGVGVQGDEIAEIIYFSIDRFFDAVDLAEREILIQWKHDKDPTEEEYLSAVYKKSLTLQPGKIVFGWPISGEMTTKAGNILFSVRFYKRGVDSQGNDTLNYSFGTLTKTIKIQSALDFQIDEESLSNVINKNNKIFNNLSNSLKVNLNYDVAIPAFTGYFIVVESIVDNEKVFTLDPVQVKKCNLPVTLAIKAEIPSNVDPNTQMISSSPLSYEWGRAEYKGNDPLPYSSDIQYFKIDLTKEKYNPNEKYYIKDPSGNYLVYDKSLDTTPFDDDVELYARYSTCIPNGPGYYTAKATNLYSSGVFKEQVSETWEVPYPLSPDFKLNNPASGQTFIINSSNNSSIEAVVTSPDEGTVEAQWYYLKDIDGESKSASDKETPETSRLITNLAPAEEGFYYLRYSNNKNNASVTEESDMIAAFYQASEIDTVIHKVNGVEVTPPENSNSAIITNPGDALSVEIPLLAHQENISYVWYEYMTDGEHIKLVEENTYTPDESGWYYCKIINNYKGTHSQPKNSAYFSVSIPGR